MNEKILMKKGGRRYSSKENGCVLILLNETKIR